MCSNFIFQKGYVYKLDLLDHRFMGEYAILVVEVKYKFLTMPTEQGYRQLVNQEKSILISVGAEMIDNFMVTDNLAGYDKKTTRKDCLFLICCLKGSHGAI
jgi:hypothetical protein